MNDSESGFVVLWRGLRLAGASKRLCFLVLFVSYAGKDIQLLKYMFVRARFFFFFLLCLKRFFKSYSFEARELCFRSAITMLSAGKSYAFEKRLFS